MTRYALLIVLCLPLLCLGQNYQNIVSQLGINAINEDNLHGAGVSTVDFDLDGDHDLTFCLDNEIKVYRNDNGSATLVDFGFEVDDNAKHPTWVDYDNDGDLDFYFSQMLAPNKLYRNDNLVFTEVTESVGLSSFPASSFGASWGDFDNDGDLDLYQCNYVYVLEQGQQLENWTNQLYRNNGNGSFSNITVQAGVGDGISLSFQSLWCDFDNDGWQDLYVINDLEHPNSLYHNNADGTFTEMGLETGSAVTEMDAMSITPIDFNNDGAEDIFITNVQIQECALLMNLGDGSFENVASSANVTLSQLTWGAVALDYDNDTDQDIYVCENNYLVPQLPNPLLRNNGENYFTNIGINTFVFDFFDSYSAASLDWNQDGYLDIAVHNFSPQNASLWRSTGGDQHFASFKLQGTISNPWGVGAKLILWSQGVAQSRRLYVGQNYLAQHPYELHFGLSDHEIIDSLQVFWPSGYQEKWYNLEVNQQHTLVEGATYTCEITSTEDFIICDDEVLTLEVIGEGEALWNTNDNGSAIDVYLPGVYSVELTNEFGLVANAEVEVFSADVPLPIIASAEVSCHGGNDGSAYVETEDWVTGIIWNDENTLFDRMDLQAGVHDFILTTDQNCSFEFSLEIEEPDEIVVGATTQNPLCHGGNDGVIIPSATGGNEPYVFSSPSGDLNALPAGEHIVYVIDANACEDSVEVSLIQPDVLEATVEVSCDNDSIYAELTVFGGNPPYEFSWSSGSDQSSVQVEMQTLDVIVTDEHGCYLTLEDIECVVSVREIDSHILVSPNPTNGWVYLDGWEGESFQLFSANGNLIREVASQIIDLSLLPAGQYLLVSESGYVIRIQRIP